MRTILPHALFLVVIGAVLVWVSSGCSTFTTPMRDCKSMCQGPVVEYTSSDSEHCGCFKKETP